MPDTTPLFELPPSFDEGEKEPPKAEETTPVSDFMTGAESEIGSEVSSEAQTAIHEVMPTEAAEQQALADLQADEAADNVVSLDRAREIRDQLLRIRELQEETLAKARGQDVVFQDESGQVKEHMEQMAGRRSSPPEPERHRPPQYESKEDVGADDVEEMFMAFMRMQGGRRRTAEKAGNEAAAAAAEAKRQMLNGELERYWEGEPVDPENIPELIQLIEQYSKSLVMQIRSIKQGGPITGPKPWIKDDNKLARERQAWQQVLDNLEEGQSLPWDPRLSRVEREQRQIDQGQTGVMPNMPEIGGKLNNNK